MNKAFEMQRNRYRFRCLPKKRYKKHVFGDIGSIGNGIGLHTSMNSPTMGGPIKEENAKILTTRSFGTWPTPKLGYKNAPSPTKKKVRCQGVSVYVHF